MNSNIKAFTDFTTKTGKRVLRKQNIIKINSCLNFIRPSSLPVKVTLACSSTYQIVIMNVTGMLYIMLYIIYNKVYHLESAIIFHAFLKNKALILLNGQFF